MNDIPKNRYEILDLIFTFLIAQCMILTSVYLLFNLVVSIIYIVVVGVFALVVIKFWKSRNPFTVYMVRTFAINNFITTAITLLFYFSDFTPSSTYFLGYIFLLAPSGIYLLISYKFSAISSIEYDRRKGAIIDKTGRTKSAKHRLYRDNPEERLKQEELLAQQRRRYKYKPIFALCMVLSLSSVLALIFGIN